MACDLLHAKGLSRRHVVDRLVHGAAFGCLLLALGCLVWLLTGLVSTGWSGFSQSEVRLAISYPLEGEIKAPQLLKEALLAKLPALEPADQRMAARLISSKAPFELVTHLKTHPALRGKTEDVWVLLSDEADMQVKGKAVAGKLQPVQEAALATLQSQGDIRTAFNWRLFANTDSREPEAAGLLGGLAGTLWVMVLALLMVLPVGIAAAVWFEEFANRTLVTRVLEICLNNLAAVPSIVLGLLGLGLFIDGFGLPRSSVIVGALVIAVMLLPTIVIATRSALRSVPDGVRDASLALGATPLQTVWAHVLPAARPGIMTGAVLGLAHAIGETAPLIMIGMVAFIGSVPSSLFSSATLLPVQIYMWADSAERAFVERTAAAILVLMALLMVISAIALVIRKRTEIKW